MTINREQRMRTFRLQFSSCRILDGYIDPKGREDLSQFDRDCDKLVKAFKSKWPTGFDIHKEEYLTKFSNTKWSELPNAEKIGTRSVTVPIVMNATMHTKELSPSNHSINPLL